jgi:hypothetical protein
MDSIPRIQALGASMPYANIHKSMDSIHRIQILGASKHYCSVNTTMDSIHGIQGLGNSRLNIIHNRPWLLCIYSRTWGFPSFHII